MLTGLFTQCRKNLPGYVWSVKTKHSLDFHRPAQRLWIRGFLCIVSGLLLCCALRPPLLFRHPWLHGRAWFLQVPTGFMWCTLPQVGFSIPGLDTTLSTCSWGVLPRRVHSARPWQAVHPLCLLLTKQDLRCWFLAIFRAFLLLFIANIQLWQDILSS